PAAVSRELTKTYEETRRGSLAELAGWAAEGVRGEITVVVAGAPEAAVDLSSGVAEVLARIASGEKLSTVVSAVAEASGLPRKALYAATLDARKDTL
ncbi:MAG: 16S rRNA (cytidine(1402)-2'-O)-methyltransferase, partial [Propionicimonas sp.]|nr:16S rRNA (cytidine(1402)-2'-O)-methyltransferase [Propionicimonas sp.]